MTVPAWAERLLAGERPDPYGAESSELFGWLFLEEAVPGLPSADSDAGRALWDRAR